MKTIQVRLGVRRRRDFSSFSPTPSANPCILADVFIRIPLTGRDGLQPLAQPELSVSGHYLKPLFEPAAVAMFGASERPGSVG
ncbi:MAG: hypothetical protein R3236_05655, partial [Phycisphaeraceae bacterium]|nr:hypothetical protein [Phycisphaeraceae bacterium]